MLPRLVRKQGDLAAAWREYPTFDKAMELWINVRVVL